MKKLFLLTAFLLEFTFVFGQICVDSETMYSSGGLNINYCTVYLGDEGNCKKYKVTISISNTDTDFISIAGSNIILFSGHDMFPAASKCSLGTQFTDISGDVRLAFPGQGLGFTTELKPNYSEKRSFIVYTDNTYPKVSYYITPNYVKKNKNIETSKIPNSNSKEIESKNEDLNNEIQQALAEFNGLLTKVPESVGKTNIYENTKKVLAGNSSEKIKLSTLNDSINKLKNLVKDTNYNNTIEDLRAKQLSLYKQIKQNDPNADVFMFEGNINDSEAVNIANIKKNIIDLENYLNSQGSQNQKLQAERQQQIELQNKYNSYIEQGDSAMQSQDYASAMGQYQNAQNFATTDSERAIAKQKYDQAFQKKKEVQRKNEIAEVKKRDEQENINYAATSAATIAAMSLFKDSPSLGFTSGKIYMGLNVEQLPLISNNTSEFHTNKSYIEAPLTPGFDFGIIFGIANNKIVSLYLNPRLSYNLNALSAGTNGGNFEYGGTAMVRGTWKKEFPLKLYAEAGYFQRNGNYHYDADASAEDTGVSSLNNDVRDGEFNYSVLRYGGGMMLQNIDDEEEYMIKAGVFFDKPSFFPKDMKPVLGFSLQGMLNSLGSLEIYYSKNYFIGGNVLYPATLERENKSYFGIKFTRTGKLW